MIANIMKKNPNITIVPKFYEQIDINDVIS